MSVALKIKNRRLAISSAGIRIKERFLGAVLGGALLSGLLLPALVFAQPGPLPATAPRSRQVIDVTRVNESWARDWEVTHTAGVFPGGGRAGFYRRPPRMGDAVPHAGRTGILYLYPESDYRPARILRRHVQITQGASRLAIGACANRSPAGEWILRVLVDGRRLGDEVDISWRDGWQDIAFNLSAYTGRRVDIEIEAHAGLRRAAQVYIDYVRLEDPARRPVSRLPGPDAGERDSASFPVTDGPPIRENMEERIEDTVLFDIYYWNFLDLLQEREEARRSERNDFYYHDYRLNRGKPPYYRKRP